jgi:hypothetical protein
MAKIEIIRFPNDSPYDKQRVEEWIPPKSLPPNWPPPDPDPVTDFPSENPTDTTEL